MQEIKGPKKKNFRVFLHIIEVKGATPLDDGSNPDLVVTATVTGQATKYTRVVRDSVACQFDQHHEWFFTANFDDFNESTLQLRLLNARTRERSESLGMYIIKLRDIRKQPMCEHFMTWLALYSSASHYTSEISAAIRVTVSCVSGRQEPPTHSLDEVVDAQDDDNPLVLMPPLVRYRQATHVVLISASLPSPAQSQPLSEG